MPPARRGRTHMVGPPRFNPTRCVSNHRVRCHRCGYSTRNDPLPLFGSRRATPPRGPLGRATWRPVPGCMLRWPPTVARRIIPAFIHLFHSSSNCPMRSVLRFDFSINDLYADAVMARPCQTWSRIDRSGRMTMSCIISAGRTCHVIA